MMHITNKHTMKSWFSLYTIGGKKSEPISWEYLYMWHTCLPNQDNDILLSFFPLDRSNFSFFFFRFWNFAIFFLFLCFNFQSGKVFQINLTDFPLSFSINLVSVKVHYAGNITKSKWRHSLTTDKPLAVCEEKKRLTDFSMSLCLKTAFYMWQHI